MWILEGTSNMKDEMKETKIRPNYSTTQISSWFLYHNRCLQCFEDEEYLTNGKIQKLLYYAQGCHLVLKGSPLFSEAIIRTNCGVKILDNEKHAFFETNPIIYEETYSEQIDQETESILELVYEEFGCYSSWGLSQLLQSESIWKESEVGKETSLNKIQKYFEENYVER